MAQSATFYLFNTLSASSAVTKPVGFFGTYGEVSMNGGNNAKALLPVSNQKQRGVVYNSFSAITASANNRLGLVQFLTSPLTGQSEISAGNWAVGLALQLLNAQSTYTWNGFIYLYLLNSDATLKTTILNNITIGSTGRTSTDELTCYKTDASGAAFTPASGDFLCLEVGIYISNTDSVDITPQILEFDQGLSSISSDEATTTSACSFITCPDYLYFTSESLNEKNEVTSLEGVIDMDLSMAAATPTVAEAKAFGSATSTSSGIPSGRLVGFIDGLQKPGG